MSAPRGHDGRGREDRGGGPPRELPILALVVVGVLLARPLAEFIAGPPGPEPWRECVLQGGEGAILARDGDRELRLEIDGNAARASGTMTSAVLCKMRALRQAHPDLSLLVLDDINGSIDEDRTMAAARELRDWGIATHVSEDAEVASGGVTLFLGGAERSIGPGAQLGVHSWAYTNGAGEGRALPSSHPEHDIYLAFYRDIGIDPAFYWFTLAAAGADDLHLMTPGEIERFGLVTQPRPIRSAVQE